MSAAINAIDATIESKTRDLAKALEERKSATDRLENAERSVDVLESVIAELRAARDILDPPTPEPEPEPEPEPVEEPEADSPIFNGLTS